VHQDYVALRVAAADRLPNRNQVLVNITGI
jgi:hypothetical protein